MGLLDRLRRLLGADDDRDGDRSASGRDGRGPPDPAEGRTTPSRETEARATGRAVEDGPGATADDRSGATTGGERATTSESDPPTSATEPVPTAGDAGERDGRADAEGGATGEAPVAEAVGDDPEAFREQAEELADFWDEYGLDFSPASLPQLDQLLADQADAAGQMRVELEDRRTATVAPIAASTACYFAETLIRSYDARWAEDDDYRWALAVPTPGGGEVRLNAFGIAHDGLADAPRFAVTHDALVVEVGIDGETVADPQTEAAAAEGSDDVATAADLRRVAADDPEVAMAAAAAGIDAEELVEGFREDAADLVDSWPSYDLDYSPASLERLDALVRMELREDAFRSADFGGTDDEPSLLLTVRGMQVAGYLAETFRQHTGAGWDTDDGLALAVEGPDGTADVDPLSLAVDALREEASLAAAYDGVVSQLGIEDAGVDIDPDDPEFAPEIDEPAVTEEDAALDAGLDPGGEGVSVDMDVGADDVDLDTDDLDVDVAPDERESEESGSESRGSIETDEEGESTETDGEGESTETNGESDRESGREDDGA